MAAEPQTPPPPQDPQDAGAVTPGEPRSGEGAGSALARLQREERARVQPGEAEDQAEEADS